VNAQLLFRVLDELRFPCPQVSLEDVERAFRQAFAMLDRRIRLFLSLPLTTLSAFALQREIDHIGKLWSPLGSNNSLAKPKRKAELAILQKTES